MFKWDRLLRRNKISKDIRYMKDEIGNASEAYLYFEAEKSQEDRTTEQEEYEIVEMEILPTKIICPDCGGITLEGLEFCDKCGGEL
ncbi:MAG: hypothetical protein GX271_08670 [Clostridiales bacterium]|nr:hypothetical protein [Clostridiales bacterium]